MASKKTKTNDELDELFSSLGDDAGPKKNHPKPKTAASKIRADQAEKDKDILADLESQLGDQPARPHTPRLKDTAGSKRTSTQTPPPGRQSEDNSNKPATNLPRKSVDSARSLHASFTPSATSFTPSATSSDLQDAEKRGTVEQTAPAAGGGWWGGIFATATATASAAIKQAEVVYKDIQHNEDAKKYLESVRGNVDVIRGYGEFSCMSDFLPKFLYRASASAVLFCHALETCTTITPNRRSAYNTYLIYSCWTLRLDHFLSPSCQYDPRLIRPLSLI